MDKQYGPRKLWEGYFDEKENRERMRAIEDWEDNLEAARVVGEVMTLSFLSFMVIVAMGGAIYCGIKVSYPFNIIWPIVLCTVAASLILLIYYINKRH